MNHYRLFFLSQGKLLGHASNDYEGDLDALEDGYKLCADKDVEIWQGDRLVARVKAGGYCPPLRVPIQDSLLG